MATDSFTYSDGNLQTVSGGVWVQRTGTATVSTNRVTTSNRTDDTESYWSTAVTDDQYSQAVVTNNGTGQYSDAGVATRIATGAHSHYMLVIDQQNGDLALYRASAGSFATLGTYAAGTGTGTLRLESVGSSHTGYLNGVPRITVTDATHTSGRVGIHIYLETGTGISYVDDWDGGSLGATAVAANPPVLVGLDAATIRSSYW
jgi:hypothetical protein